MFPFIYQSKDFAIPTYIFVLSFTYSLGIIWLVKRTQSKDYNRNTCLDICLAIMIGGFIGARGLHVLYEHPDYYLQNPSSIFKVWQGGFVFYGGALLGAFSAWLIIKIKKESFWKWSDVFTPVLAIGYGIGRLSCFFAGCCYGKPCDLPWGMRFPVIGEAPGGIYRHPTQLYAFLFEVTVGIALLALEKNTKSSLIRKPGSIFLIWITLHGTGRWLMESFRDDFRGNAPLGLSISTWISIFLILIGISLMGNRLLKERKV